MIAALPPQTARIAIALPSYTTPLRASSSSGRTMAPRASFASDDAAASLVTDMPVGYSPVPISAPTPIKGPANEGLSMTTKVLIFGGIVAAVGVAITLATR